MNLTLKTLLAGFNETFTFFCIFPAIICLGVYFTLKLRCVQISKLKMSLFYLLKKDTNEQGNISHFQAVSAVLAGNFGTGNISGMAVAIATGGPGALVWMWVMAFLGASIQYASCLLGVKYRKKNEEGEYVGGPMYYLSDGLGFKFLGVLFAICTLIGALTVGNFAQVNSIALPLQKLGFNPLICGLVMSVLVGLVTLGGIERVAKLASVVVPFKACIYLGTALLIIVLNVEQLIPALKLMFTAAFSPHSILGGVAGFGVVKAITTGFDRGIFATDAGTGIVPILQSSARTTNPVIDGVVTLITPFLVMIVCTATGLVLIVTGAWQQSDLRSTNMVTYAFEQGLNSEIGAYIVIVALILFAYTTILAWACCAEKAIGFLFGTRNTHWFKYVYILLVPVGAIIHVDMIWILADISISFMLIINMIGVARLSSDVIKESRDYFLQEKIDPQVSTESPLEVTP